MSDSDWDRWVSESSLPRAADTSYGRCARPDECQGTDAGGNCRLMRKVPWKLRICHFNSDRYHYDTADGEADALLTARNFIAWAESEGRCSNCGAKDEDHDSEGHCPRSEWDEMYDEIEGAS